MVLTFSFNCELADVVVAPPFLYIDQVKGTLTDRIEISAQNSWVDKGGAFTGEIRLDFTFSFFFFFFLFITITVGVIDFKSFT